MYWSIRIAFVANCHEITINNTYRNQKIMKFNTHDNQDYTNGTLFGSDTTACISHNLIAIILNSTPWDPIATIPTYLSVNALICM